MADEPEKAEADEDGEASPKKSGGSPIPFLVIGMLGVGLGLLVPLVLPANADAPEEQAKEPAPVPDYTKEPDETVYIPFGESSIVVNLDGDRMSRYLSMNFFLKVSKESNDSITQLLEDKMPPLKSWLITHLSAYTIEDVRGPAGQNKVRREIRDQFNTIMFPNGGDRIFDILFSEFAVQ